MKTATHGKWQCYQIALTLSLYWILFPLFHQSPKLCSRHCGSSAMHEPRDCIKSRGMFFVFQFSMWASGPLERGADHTDAGLKDNGIHSSSIHVPWWFLESVVHSGVQHSPLWKALWNSPSSYLGWCKSTDSYATIIVIMIGLKIMCIWFISSLRSLIRWNSSTFKEINQRRGQWA